MNSSFQNKVAFVTGASSGIGRATAIAFAREGASVVVADIAEAGNQETARQINDLGGGALPVKCDEHAKKLPQPSSGCVRMPLLSLGNVRIVRRTFFKVDGSRCRHGGDYLGEWVGASDSNTN